MVSLLLLPAYLQKAVVLGLLWDLRRPTPVWRSVAWGVLSLYYDKGMRLYVLGGTARDAPVVRICKHLVSRRHTSQPYGELRKTYSALSVLWCAP